jgi:hypothetical protein
MADVTIRFRHNPATGKRDLVISYESDQDALPHEHERDHRALVEQLIGQKLGDDVGEIHVERGGERVTPPDAGAEPPAPTPAPAPRAADKVGR